jgi:23S rRNA-intervening sequence protein
LIRPPVFADRHSALPAGPAGFSISAFEVIVLPDRRERAVAFDFEKVLAYQKSVDFADHVCASTETFQRGYGFLVDQLNRAALSISANNAEGNCHRSFACLRFSWSNRRLLDDFGTRFQ